MDTLKAMHMFVRTMELGSLSATARELGTTQPNVSKVLTALEAQLQVRLLERSTKGPVPTDQGRQFYEQAKAILEHYDGAVGAVRGLARQPSGILRINAPVALGQFRVNLLVHEFMRRHPDISVELILNDRFVDLVEEGVDVALRLGGVLPPNAVARHLAVAPRLLAAAPAYLEEAGIPAHPSELDAHRFVRFAWTSADPILLQRDGEAVRVQAAGRYRVNNALAIREALVLGAGIGLCPAWLVHDALAKGELVPVLPAWSAGAQDLHVLYPSRRFQVLRSRLFVDFLAHQFLALPGFLAPPMGASISKTV